jgi:hypothetical protein
MGLEPSPYKRKKCGSSPLTPTIFKGESMSCPTCGSANKVEKRMYPCTDDWHHTRVLVISSYDWILNKGRVWEDIQAEINKVVGEVSTGCVSIEFIGPHARLHHDLRRENNVTPR